MVFIRNLLALVGLLIIVGAVWAAVEFAPYVDTLRGFDPKAPQVYMELVKKLLNTGNIAEATVWKVEVNEDLSAQDVEDALKLVANEHNFKHVGQDLPLYKEIEALSGTPYRFVKIFMFCNALTAAKMLDYSGAYGAYVPCRITLLQDPGGRYWLYTLNMDLMIHGGAELPPDLKKEAIAVRDITRDMLARAAEGEF